MVVVDEVRSGARSKLLFKTATRNSLPKRRKLSTSPEKYESPNLPVRRILVMKLSSLMMTKIIVRIKSELASKKIK